MSSVQTFKNLIKHVCNCRNEVNESSIEQVVPLVVGRQGIGKSGIMQQIADELGIDSVVLSGSKLEHPADVTGYPEPVPEENKTVILPPEWFQSMKESEEGILFIDEFLRVAPPAQNALYEFLLSGKISPNHQKPEGWTIVCATNPPTADFHVEDMDDALVDRFLVYPFGGDAEAWFDWAERNGIHQDLIGYYRNNPDLVELSEPEIPFDIEPTLRSLELADILYSRSLDDDLIYAIIAGLIGEENYQPFREWITSQEEDLDPEDILSNYPQYQQIIKDYSEGDEKRMDILNPIVQRTIDYVKQKIEEGSAATLRKPLISFIKDLPADLGSKIYHQVGEEDASLVRDQELHEVMGN